MEATFYQWCRSSENSAKNAQLSSAGIAGRKRSSRGYTTPTCRDRLNALAPNFSYQKKRYQLSVQAYYAQYPSNCYRQIYCRLVMTGSILKRTGYRDRYAPVSQPADCASTSLSPAMSVTSVAVILLLIGQPTTDLEHRLINTDRCNQSPKVGIYVILPTYA